MNNIPIQNVWFDDAATFAMGEAFDRACKSLGNLGSAVPEIIDCLIIQAAGRGRCFARANKPVESGGSAVPDIFEYLIIKAPKAGNPDPARLYGQVLK